MCPYNFFYADAGTNSPATPNRNTIVLPVPRFQGIPSSVCHKSYRKTCTSLIERMSMNLKEEYVLSRTYLSGEKAQETH